MASATIRQNKEFKILRSDGYNYNFNRLTGMFARWGKTVEEDPNFSPVGPEIADIEISTICSGVKGVGVCQFCYKSNTPKGSYMSLDTFKRLFRKFPPTLTQIAFGIGDIEANPDMWDIFAYSREHGIVPNVTVNGEGITDEIADKLVKYCGAVAVSVYDKNKSYDTVKKLTDRGLKQVNIHFMICEETFDKAFEVMNDKLTDPRLEKLNAIVLLSLKPKGRAVKSGYTRLEQSKFRELVDFALEHKIGVGFDSCGCHKFLESIEGHPNQEALTAMSDPCESALFSSYFNTDGLFFPCSFAEGNEDVEWKEGLNVIDYNGVWWEDERVEKWRQRLLGNCRNCPMYNI